MKSNNYINIFQNQNLEDAMNLKRKNVLVTVLHKKGTNGNLCLCFHVSVALSEDLELVHIVLRLVSHSARSSASWTIRKLMA